MEQSDMARNRVSDTQVSIRIPETLAERAQVLAERLTEEESFIAVHPGGVLPSVVWRLALMRGLTELEREYQVGEASTRLSDIGHKRGPSKTPLADLAKSKRGKK